MSNENLPKDSSDRLCLNADQSVMFNNNPLLGDDNLDSTLNGNSLSETVASNISDVQNDGNISTGNIRANDVEDPKVKQGVLQFLAALVKTSKNSLKSASTEPDKTILGDHLLKISENTLEKCESNSGHFYKANTNEQNNASNEIKKNNLALAKTTKGDSLVKEKVMKMDSKKTEKIKKIKRKTGFSIKVTIYF